MYVLLFYWYHDQVLENPGLHREGVSLEVISRLLTHRSISTTSDLYLHLEAEDLRAGLEMAKGGSA